MRFLWPGGRRTPGLGVPAVLLVVAASGAVVATALVGMRTGGPAPALLHAVTRPTHEPVAGSTAGGTTTGGAGAASAGVARGADGGEEGTGSTAATGTAATTGASRAGPRASRAQATIERTVLHGQPTLLAVPAHPDGRLVMWVHGHGGSARSFLDLPASQRLRDALLAQGYLLASSDAHADAWGNPASVRDLLATERWVERHHRVTATYVLGQSMGGLASQRLAARTRAEAWVGVYPVCTPASLVSRFPAARTAAALRFTRPAWYGVPVLLLASDHDTVVPKASNALACAARARRAGARVRVVDTRGDHGDPTNYRPARILRFLAAAPARPGTRVSGPPSDRTSGPPSVRASGRANDRAAASGAVGRPARGAAGRAARHTAEHGDHPAGRRGVTGGEAASPAAGSRRGA